MHDSDNKTAIEFHETGSEMVRSFGKKIRAARIKRQWSQEDLAEAVGVSPNFIGNLERNSQKCNYETAFKIARELRISGCDLLSHKCPCTDDRLVKEIVQLFGGKKWKETQKALRILEVFFDASASRADARKS